MDARPAAWVLVRCFYVYSDRCNCNSLTLSQPHRLGSFLYVSRAACDRTLACSVLAMPSCNNIARHFTSDPRAFSTNWQNNKKATAPSTPERHGVHQELPLAPFRELQHVCAASPPLASYERHHIRSKPRQENQIRLHHLNHHALPLQQHGRRAPPASEVDFLRPHRLVFGPPPALFDVDGSFCCEAVCGDCGGGGFSSGCTGE